MNYPFKSVETKVQKAWEERGAFHAEEVPDKPKFYCLSMFPYPSGRLHVGHVRNYTISDMLARYRRMCGDNVLQPLGWDAFGMPAENAAIENNIAPAEWTMSNISEMRAQLKQLGLAIDWRRELATCDADYYRWEQEFFIRLYEQGIVYKKTGMVNWDPVDKTVLANEQVEDGKGWRSGAAIERREIPMYFMKITDYADELLTELDNLPDWPEPVKTMQRNWIGYSQGARVLAKIEGQDRDLEFYTTRPDTIFGMTFCAVAPEHPVALSAAENDATLKQFIENCQKLAVTEEALEKVEKEGYRLPFCAIHPLDPTRKIPIFVANYILAQYGTGAIYGCPAHDQRDLDFARQYNLEVIPVVLPHQQEHLEITDIASVATGTLINSKMLNGMPNQEAKQAVIDLLEKNGRGRAEEQYRLRDWGISRQRYWGCPIPIVHCASCGDVPEKVENLPIRLPLDLSISGRGTPLAECASFIQCTCPQCGKPARRETDTMDTFVESSWYFLRYPSYNCNTQMVDERVNYWLPTDQYIGGIEHACLHLLYARFYHKLMRDAGLFNNTDGKRNEPFTRLLCQGMVLKDGGKMSKSKGNTVDPQAIIDDYGADTVRLFIIFASPPEQTLEWSDSGIKGSFRFLNRLWAAAQSLPDWEKQTGDSPDEATANTVKAGEKKINSILQKAHYDMERMRYNNIPSAAMQIVNTLYSLNQCRGAATVLRHGMSLVLRLLAPVVPHITQELWQQLGFGDHIIDAPWPAVQQLAEESHQLVVQINGKKRGTITAPTTANQDDIIAIIKTDDAIGKHLTGTPKKVIIVPARLVNIVV